MIREVAFYPARILMPDSSGIPLLIDLAAMRDAVKTLGHDPKRVNPINPVDLVLDRYIARRANHEVMNRGTFANIRIRNEMVPGHDGGYTAAPASLTTLRSSAESILVAGRTGSVTAAASATHYARSPPSVQMRGFDRRRPQRRLRGIETNAALRWARQLVACSRQPRYGPRTPAQF